MAFDYPMLNMDAKISCHFYNTSLIVLCGVSGESFVQACEQKFNSSISQKSLDIEKIKNDWFSEVYQVKIYDPLCIVIDDSC